MMVITKNANPDCPHSDAALVRGALDGDRAAYGELYDRYARLVRMICYDTTRTVADAQDISQEVFLRAYKALRELRKPERYAPWIMTITRNVCKGWTRRRARERDRFTELRPDDLIGPDTPSGNGEVRELYDALFQLPERQRRAIYSFYLLDESTEKARAALNLSRSGFYRLLQRARKRMKNLLREK